MSGRTPQDIIAMAIDEWLHQDDQPCGMDLHGNLLYSDRPVDEFVTEALEAEGYSIVKLEPVDSLEPAVSCRGERPGGHTVSTFGELDDAKKLLEANGYVILKAKSYRQAQERQRIAEALQASAEREAENARQWARDCLTKERGLADRCAELYGLAKSLGATDEQLHGRLVREDAQ